MTMSICSPQRCGARATSQFNPSSRPRDKIQGRRPRTEALSKCAFVGNVVAKAHRIDANVLHCASRCQAPVAYARQIAMYLAHVSCGLTLTEVGRGFGRDRTTVAHACKLVEDRRDAPETDLALDYLEAAITEWFGAVRMRQTRPARPAVSR
jgi:hypothetical protein